MKIVLLLLLVSCTFPTYKTICQEEEKYTWLKECMKFSNSEACKMRANLLFCKTVKIE